MSFILLIAIHTAENNASGFPNKQKTKTLAKGAAQAAGQGQQAELFSQQGQILSLQWANIISWNNHTAPTCWKGSGVREETEGCDYYFCFKILEVLR